MAKMCGNAALSKYSEELIATAKKITSPGKGILAADESTGTVGKRVSTPFALPPVLLFTACSQALWSVPVLFPVSLGWFCKCSCRALACQTRRGTGASCVSFCSPRPACRTASAAWCALCSRNRRSYASAGLLMRVCRAEHCSHLAAASVGVYNSVHPRVPQRTRRCADPV